MSKKLQEYHFQVPVKGFQNYYVQASSRKEAVKMFQENHDAVECELDDIQWDVDWHVKDINKFIDENVEE